MGRNINGWVLRGGRVKNKGGKKTFQIIDIVSYALKTGVNISGHKTHLNLLVSVVCM